MNREINIKWLFLIVFIYAIEYILNFENVFKYNTIIWLVIFLVTFKFFDTRDRIKSKLEKVQLVFIIILSYFIIYYLSGLFIGFSRSPYSHDLISIIKNIWNYLIIIFFQEYVRYILVVNEKKNSSALVLIVLMFSIFEINIISLFNNSQTIEMIFKYYFSTLLVILTRNILLTYLSTNGGLRVQLIYRAPIVFVNLVAPIFPAYDWFMVSLSGILLPFITYIVFQYFRELKVRKESKRVLKKQSPIKSMPFILLVLIIISFISGFFKYKPVAIMSNSMADIINRGDAVIVEKLNENEIKSLQIGDIIEYKLNNSIIVHRIIEIDKDDFGNLFFTTKGDNNKREDDKKVSESQILGRVVMSIPKIGYPSVLLSELFSKKKPDVELGK